MSRYGIKSSQGIQVRREYILNAPILPLLFKMSIPTIIGMLISIIYNLTDTYFIGQLGNKSMIAAIGIVYSFVSVIQAIGFWFGYGSGNVMSKYIGANKEEESEIISSIGIDLSIIVGIILSLICFIYVKELTVFIGGNASKNSMLYSTEYLRIIIISIPFTLYSITLYNQLRLCGSIKDAMIGLLSGMLLNMILDPIFIFKIRIGFIGAGYATLIGQIISSIVLTCLSMRKGNINVNILNFKLSKDRLYHILMGGSPNFARQVITSISLVLLNIVCAKYSEDLIAAMTISFKIIGIAYLIVIGWGQGFQPICAMNYGVGNHLRVRKAFIYSLLIGTLFLIISTILIFRYAPFLIKLMIKDRSIIHIGIKILRIQCITLPLLALYAISSMFMQNVGEYMKSLIISISRQGYIFIPLLFLMSFFFGEFGVYWVQPVSDIISFLIATLIVLKYCNKNLY